MQTSADCGVLARKGIGVSKAGQSAGPVPSKRSQKLNIEHVVDSCGSIWWRSCLVLGGMAVYPKRRYGQEAHCSEEGECAPHPKGLMLVKECSPVFRRSERMKQDDGKEQRKRSKASEEEKPLKENGTPMLGGKGEVFTGTLQESYLLAMKHAQKLRDASK